MITIAEMLMGTGSSVLLAVSLSGIGAAAAVVGITGLIIGILLGIAGKAFAVQTDERETAVRDLLPGNNCGGCGYAGCDGLAAAIAKGEAPVNACPVAGGAIHAQIGEIMGSAVEEKERMTAYVKCAGTCDKTRLKYEYYGIADCKKLTLIPGQGEKQCAYGCMGYGSCVNACAFDAIHVENGVAVVDREKCVACGKCVAECPNHLIELVPYGAPYRVQCASGDKGKVVKAACDAGCIGCTLCVKQCDAGAITMVNNSAHIDYSKCTGCGKCAEKCPSKIIRKIG